MAINFDDESTGVSYQQYPKDPLAREQISILDNKVEQLKEKTVSKQEIIDIESKVRQSDLDKENFKEQVNTEVTTIKGMVEGLDGGNLEKITQLETQIGGKANKDLVDNLYNQIEDKASAQSVTQLTSQLAEKATKAEVRLKTDKTKPEDLSPETLSLVTGTGTINLLSIPQDGSVTAEKTTFVKVGKNKFQGTYERGVEGTTGKIYRTTADGTGNIAIVKVEKNKTYSILLGSVTEKFRVFVTTGKPNLGGVMDRMAYTDDTQTKTKLNSISLTGEQDHILIDVGKTVPTWLQVEEGTVTTEYRPYSVVFDVEEKSFNLSKIKDLDLQGFLAGSESIFNVDIPNQKIVLTGSGYINVGNNRYVPIGGEYSYASFASSTTIVAFNISTKKIEFYSSENYYSRDVNTIAYLGIIRRGAYTDQSVSFNGIYSVNGSRVIPYTKSDRDKFTPSFVITDMPDKNYEYQGSNIPITTIQTSDIYSKYDALMAAYPKYITKTVLGTESSGLEIINYKFSPPKPTEQLKNLPKIIAIGNIHGQEKHIAPATYLFFKDLCENWKTNDVLRMLRWNVEFSIIPIINPYGFNNTQRPNAKGVDLNRNFTNGWVLKPVDDYYYGGASPLSEVETQVATKFMTDNRDAIFFLDHHNFGGMISSGYGIWYGSDFGENSRSFFNALGIQIITQLRKRVSYIPDNNTSLSVVSKPSAATMMNHWQTTFGINGALLETPYEFGIANETESDLQTYTVDVIGNTYAKVIKHYDLIRFKS